MPETFYELGMEEKFNSSQNLAIEAAINEKITII